MSWGWNSVYDYDYEDTPEYLLAKAIRGAQQEEELARKEKYYEPNE